MKFSVIVEQVSELLRHRQRVSYRALKREFDLDDEDVEDLKAELIDAKRLASDEDGKVLVWTGAVAPVQSSEFQVQSPPQPLTSNPQHPAERRQLTVMFCDLVGSTALSTQLDPEELREVVRDYQQTSAAVIEHFGGHIAQYLGDGLLVYFGYPVAHEDDAARAVRAGLEIITALQEQVPSPLAGEGQGEGAKSNAIHTPHPNLLPQGEKELRRLHVRIGIHTGPVVVGEMGGGAKREQLALGETPNIAARIQGTANPDEVVISAATYRLVEGLFECEDRGQPELKGVPTPLTLYRVVKEGEAQSRFQVIVRKGLTPLIGREHEFGLLHDRWQRAKDGAGQIVLLSGEPGIGKSRLVEALKETVEHEGTRCLELRCSPYAQNSALQPVIEHLQRGLGFHSKDSPEEKLRKLEAGARRAVPLPPEAIPLLAALLSLPHPQDFPALTLSPQKQKEKTYEVLVAWLCAEAKHQTVTYAWEDLHWADPSTLEFLTLFLTQVPTTRLLVVLTFRPEFTVPWGSHSYLSQLTLSRLGQSHVEVMVGKVTGGKALPPEIVRQIASKTDGVPLFVEELTRSVVESVGATSRSPLQLEIPTTLQDALMARLDRLGTAKEIAQLGATIGREFTHALLQAVSPLNEERLQQGLRQLVDAELVFQSGVPPQTRYLFKHALVQDTAYQSLLKRRRQELHQQIAQVLQEQFPATTETQPELLARHYTEAGFNAQAIPYWQQAGQKAVQRSANKEAIAHLTKGLELLRTLPDALDRTQQELRLLTTLGIPLVATKGFAAPEVEQTYARARELSEQVGEDPDVFVILTGLRSFHMVRGDTLIARALGKRLLRLAEQAQDSALLLEAHTAFAVPSYFLGELELGRAHLEQTLALYDPQQHSAHAAFVMDPGVSCRGHLGTLLWILGYPDQAVRRVEEGVEQARAGTRLLSLGFALNAAAAVHLHRKEFTAAQRYTDEVITLCHDYGLPQFIAWGVMGQGVIRCAQGHVVEGIEQIERGIAIHRATGARFMLTSFLATLARQYGDTGAYHKGFELIHEDMAIANTQKECLFEADMYRVKGELTLQQFQVPSFKFQVPPNLQSLTPSTQTEAEGYFHKAIEIARRQSAKSLELRAAMSLARLWQQQGKKAEARELLAPIYNWFTEGFDTKDLQEAKALIEELSD